MTQPQAHRTRRARRRPAAGGVPLVLLCALWLAARDAAASPVEVVQVLFEHQGGARWRVSATLRHDDAGWHHYANVWVVETRDGTELGRRELLHPHVHEQPFTRSTTVILPEGTAAVRVRAGDNVEGLNSNVVRVDLREAEGERFEVRR